MKIFSFLKKPQELAITRKVLMEKWEEGGADVCQSLSQLIRNKIAPALAAEMKKAGFDYVGLKECRTDGRDESWYLRELLHKKLCSGKRNSDFDYMSYNEGIDSFDSYSKWATRAEKMLEKIAEIKKQVEEMKKRRNELLDLTKAL